MPNGLKHAHKSSAYDSLSAEFKDFIDTYRNLEGLGYSKKHLKSTSYMVCSFLLDLQNKGINSFKSVTEESVLDVFFFRRKDMQKLQLQIHSRICFQNVLAVLWRWNMLQNAILPACFTSCKKECAIPHQGRDVEHKISA